MFRLTSPVTFSFTLKDPPVISELRHVSFVSYIASYCTVTAFRGTYYIHSNLMLHMVCSIPYAYSLLTIEIKV